MNAVVEKLNETYTQVKIGGRYRYWDGYDFLTEPDFIKGERGNSHRVEIDGKVTYIDNTKTWLNSKERNLKKKCTFHPGDVPEDTFNLWKGWVFEPIKGKGHLKFKEHACNNMCNGDLDHFHWLWGWLIQIVQQPDKKMGTGIVLRSREEGTGKSAFCYIIGQLFGKAYTKVAKDKQILGKFNALLQGKLLVCLEEAIFAGDKKGASALKDLMTSPTATIEMKGLEVFSVPDYCRFILATNKNWSTDAGPTSRRLFCPTVGTGWYEKDEKFQKMFDDLDAGGYNNLMYELLNTDLEKFLREHEINLRRPPVTPELKLQRSNSESPGIGFFKYWWDKQIILDNDEYDPLKWSGRVWAEDLEAEMKEYFKGQRGYHPANLKALMSEVRCAGIIPIRDKGRHGKLVKWYYQFDTNIEL